MALMGAAALSVQDVARENGIDQAVALHDYLVMAKECYSGMLKVWGNGDQELIRQFEALSATVGPIKHVGKA